MLKNTCKSAIKKTMERILLQDIILSRSEFSILIIWPTSTSTFSPKFQQTPFLENECDLNHRGPLCMRMLFKHEFMAKDCCAL
jgi:hypothetical protein